MRKFGLIGYPLSHSFSQKYFRQKFEDEGIKDACFENFSIPSITEVKDIVSNHPDLKGFGVTIPYKKAILEYLDDANDVVKQIGACNSVKISNGRLIGYNTDTIGFEQSFVPQLQPHHTKALILGTGGAALAIEFVLNKLGILCQCVSRNISPNTIIYKQIDEDILDEYTVIINCTPLGTYPKVDECPDLPYDLLSERHYLFDLVYNPPLTAFLKAGAAHGAIIKNGYDMLTGQAEASWKIWNE